MSSVSILKKKKNYKTLLSTYTSATARKKVIKFRDKVVVASIDNSLHHPIINNKTIPIDDKKRTATTMTKTSYWKLPTKTKQPPRAPEKTTTNVKVKNAFNVLENDDTYEPMQYKSRWTLDTGASGVYGDVNTICKNKKKIRRGTGTKVKTADKSCMEQVATGEAPFSRLPAKARKAEIFPKMQTPLLGCGPLVKNDCSVVFEETHASIVTGETKQIIKKVLEEADDDILMTVPFDENTLTWRTRIEDNDILNEMQEQRIPCPPQLANNVH